MLESVFYIDDNEFEHYIVEGLLKTNSDCKKVISFVSGKEALKQIRKNRSNFVELPDMILLDLCMPDFSGWDFMDEFKKLYTTLSKPIDVHILSSSVDDLAIERSKQYPFVKSYISKPLTQLIVERF
jgi:CheY-like chemotaxis protein